MRKFIYESVKSVSRDVSFSTPGHKGQNLDYLKAEYDVTELDETDNLLAPKGAILYSMEELKRIYNSEKSYYLTSGSSLGIMASILSSCKRNSNILVERSCHKSVFNAIILGGLNPSYIENILDEEFLVPVGIDIKKLELILKNKNYSTLVITSPNYFGVNLDLDRIYKICRENDVLLIVDAAHGAHLNFMPEKISLKDKCDFAIMSSHKTLPSITGCAFLHVFSNRIDIFMLEKYLRILSSTSPSYLMMISMEFALSFMEENGRQKLISIISEVEKLKKELKNYGYAFLEGNIIDPTRLVLMMKDVTGHEISRCLKEFGIRCEMSTPTVAVFIISANDDKESLLKLKEALKKIKPKHETIKHVDYSYTPITIETPESIFRKESKWVKIKDTEGLISSSFVIFYPPGSPILVPGEKITRRIIEIIEENLRLGTETVGIENGGILVWT